MKKDHALRLTGLFALSAIALFSNNVWCYFAAVFIVATAVTQLEFLQNLAAIIRGSKEFFDYQKEFLTLKEVEESTAKDVEEIEEAAETEGIEIDNAVHMHAAPNVHITIDDSNMSAQHFSMICEEYAFRYIERKYQKPIQRHIRFRDGRMATEFDGILQNKKHDVVFEIKVSRKGFYPIQFIQRTADRMIERVKSYTFLTKRNASLSLVFIGDFSPKLHEKISNSIEKIKSTKPSIEVTFEILTFKEIGLEGFIDNVVKNAEPVA